MLNLHWFLYFILAILITLAFYKVLKFACHQVQHEFNTLKQIIEKSPLR